MNPETLVHLADALGALVDRYPHSAPLDWVPEGELRDEARLLFGPGRATPGRHPPSDPDIAYWPNLAHLARELAELSGSSVDELALAGLRARRWLGRYGADRRRQVHAARALGVDHRGLEASLGAASVSFPWLARSAPRDDPEAAWQALPAATRRRWQQYDVQVIHLALQDGDRDSIRNAVRMAALRYLAVYGAQARPWRWPWESFDDRPAIYPHDWSSDWADSVGRPDLVVPGVAVVVAAGASAAPARVEPRHGTRGESDEATGARLTDSGAVLATVDEPARRGLAVGFVEPEGVRWRRPAHPWETLPNEVLGEMGEWLRR